MLSIALIVCVHTFYVQIGGIFGGFKIGFSNQGLPLKVRVHSLEFRNQSLKRAVAAAFEERVSLIFTGKQVSVLIRMYLLNYI